MKTTVDAGDVRATVQAEDDGRVHLAMYTTNGRKLTSLTIDPADENNWLVIGSWDQGTPVPIAMFRDRGSVLHTYDQYPAGVWNIRVSADNPEDAGESAVDVVRSSMSPPSGYADVHQGPWRSAAVS